MTDLHHRNSQSEIVETWQPITSFDQVHVGEYLYYVSDNYFGKVIDVDHAQVRLNIQHFRIDTVSYEAKICNLQELLRPIKNIYIDEQIHEEFPDIYHGLEKSFRVWKKIESYILNTPRENRGKITPEPFASTGRIFGKWSAKGYLNKSEIEELQQKQFVKMISRYVSLDKIVDEEPDQTLEYIDNLLALPYEKVQQNPDVDIKDWLVIHSGFFVKNE